MQFANNGIQINARIGRPQGASSCMAYLSNRARCLVQTNFPFVFFFFFFSSGMFTNFFQLEIVVMLSINANTKNFLLIFIRCKILVCKHCAWRIMVCTGTLENCVHYPYCLAKRFLLSSSGLTYRQPQRHFRN